MDHDSKGIEMVQTGSNMMGSTENHDGANEITMAWMPSIMMVRMQISCHVDEYQMGTDHDEERR